MTIKNGDFVEIEYVGRVNGNIFDLTDEALAKEENVYREKMKYGPVTIIVGRSQLIKGIDKALEGRKEGDEFDIEIQPEDAFGKKNPKLLKIIPSSIFKQQKVNPVPGMQLNIDGIMGTIISASSGRVIVDFNHPLSGKPVDYHIKINRVIKDKKDRINAVFDIYANISSDKLDVKEEGKKVTVIYKAKAPLHEKAKEVISEDIKKYIGFETVELKEEIETKAENKSSVKGE